MALTVGEALHGVNVVESVLETIHATIPSMDEEQLVATYQRASELGKRAWLVQAHCLWEARERRGSYHDGAIAALASQFGITKGYAHQLCGAWEAVPSSKRLDDGGDLPLSKSFYTVAGQTDEPQRWAAHAEDRKAENPSYSVRDLRAEIQSSRIIDTDTGEVFSGGDWSEAEPAPPVPFDLRTAIVGGEVGEHAGVARWHAVTTHLYRAAREAQPLLVGWQPGDLAVALSTEEAAGLAAIGPLVDFVAAVVAARRDNQHVRRIK